MVTSNPLKEQEKKKKYDIVLKLSINYRNYFFFCQHYILYCILQKIEFWAQMQLAINHNCRIG